MINSKQITPVRITIPSRYLTVSGRELLRTPYVISTPLRDDLHRNQTLYVGVEGRREEGIAGRRSTASDARSACECCFYSIDGGPDKYLAGVAFLSVTLVTKRHAAESQLSFSTVVPTFAARAPSGAPECMPLHVTSAVHARDCTRVSSDASAGDPQLQSRRNRQPVYATSLRLRPATRRIAPRSNSEGADILWRKRIAIT